MLNKSEINTIDMIADRAVVIAGKHGHTYRKSDAFMDIMYCHESCPLDLDGLATADDSNFIHDVFGINRHLNRNTGKLEDCFLPRYSI